MPLCGAGCKLGGREPLEARMRASRVVVETPTFDDPARLSEAAEQVLFHWESPVAIMARVKRRIKSSIYRFVRPN
jgi:hypothetical protein